MKRAIALGQIKGRLGDTGLEVSTIGPEPFAQFINAEIAKWAREAGMQPE